LIARAVQEGSRVWSILPEVIADETFPAGARTALDQFRHLIVKYRDKFAASPRQLSRWLKELIAEIDYEGEIRKQHDEPIEQEQRMESLGELVNALAQYETRTSGSTLGGFLEDTALTGRDEE